MLHFTYRRCFTLLLALIIVEHSTLPAEQIGPPRTVLAADEGKKVIAIVDGKGHVLWKQVAGPIHDAHVLPSGNILFSTNHVTLVEVNRAGDVVWKYDAKSNGNENRRVEIHAFQRLESGLTMIAESGAGRIIEVDADGKIVNEIKLTIHNPNPHRDTRLVRKLASGNYLVAHEGDGAVREYDAAGKVVWEYSVPMFGKEAKPGHGPEAFGNSVFSAVRLPNGNTLIGTGNGHSVLEVTPGKEIVWQLHQNDLPGITLAWVTALQPLANGNLIFGNTHAGEDNPQIIEVTRDKKVVWQFRDFATFGNATPVAWVLDEKGQPLR